VTKELTRVEVGRALKKMKNNKATGLVEVWKIPMECENV
jgi:hypothetical protein